MKLGGTEVQWAFVHNLAVSSGDRFKIKIAQADKSIFKNKFVAGLTFFKIPTSINTRTLNGITENQPKFTIKYWQICLTNPSANQAYKFQAAFWTNQSTDNVTICLKNVGFDTLATVRQFVSRIRQKAL